MRRAVYALLTDYARRTLRFWILLAGIQFTHTSILWANRPGRVSLIGPVIGALAFFVPFKSSRLVFQTLPLSSRDLALVRWGMQVGLPALIVAASWMLTWCANLGWGFPVPPLSHALIGAGASVLVLRLLRLLPIPMRVVSGSNVSGFAVAWGLLVMAALYGYPAESLPRWLTLCIACLGVVLEAAYLSRLHLRTIAHSARSWEQRPPRTLTHRATHLRGWTVSVAQLLRSTLLLCLAGVACITLLRQLMPYLDLPELRPLLPIGFVSLTGIVGSLMSRRLLQALPALQCLPIRTDHLAMILCLILLAPGFTACAIASAVHWLAPELGLAIPLYVLPVLAIVPALSIPWNNMTANKSVITRISRWSPLLQLATWPLWTGSFSALALTKLLPTWFGTLAILLTLSCGLIGYFNVRARIRGGYGLRQSTGIAG